MRFIVERASHRHQLEEGEDRFEVLPPPCKGAELVEKEITWVTKGLDGEIAHNKTIRAWQIELKTLDDLIKFIYRHDEEIIISMCPLYSDEGFWNMEKITIYDDSIE